MRPNGAKLVSNYIVFDKEHRKDVLVEKGRVFREEKKPCQECPRLTSDLVGTSTHSQSSSFHFHTMLYQKHNTTLVFEYKFSPPIIPLWDHMVGRPGGQKKGARELWVD